MSFEEIYKKLRQIRIEKGLSQKTLGEKCGLTQQAINRIEQGQRKIDLDLLIRMSDALDVPLYELMGFDRSIRVNENIESERLDEEAQKIFIRQESGEKITEEEAQIVSDYIERTRESYYKLIESSKNLATIIDKCLNENTQMPEEIAQTLKENLQKLKDLTPTIPDFYENLNDIGREKAAEQIDMLTKIPEYQKNPPQE